MKRFILLLTALPFLLTGNLKAQLPYNFSVASIGTTPQPSSSIVKAYTPTSSVVYYIEAGNTSYGILSLVTTTGTVLYTKLPLHYFVQDMCIHEDELYLLMEKADTKQYYIGWLDLNQFYLGSFFNIMIREIQVFYTQIIQLRRLSVYTDSNGDTRLLALGDCLFPVGGQCPIEPTQPSFNYTYPYEFFPGWGWQIEQFVLECVNPKTTSTFDYLLVNSGSKNEHLADMVVTDNYVAIIGDIYNNYDFDTVTIHRCSKDGVLSSFDNYHYFIPPQEEGSVEYSACALDEDNIALVTIGYKGEQDNEFEMHIRTVKLPNMMMHPSQRLPDVGKTIPTTQIYLHQADRTMVQLSEILFPPGQQVYNHSFIEFHPYNVTQYYTTVFYEDNYSQLPYVSMDKQQDSCIIATGGNYGIIKDINNEAVSPNCYHYETVLVRLLNNRDIKARKFPYEGNNTNLVNDSSLLLHVTGNSIINCTSF